jgi:hypothetical protein
MSVILESDLLILALVESERDLRPADENGALDQIRLLRHEVDGFLLRPGKRPLFEDRTPPADEIEKVVAADVPFEKGAIRWRLVDVTLLDVDAKLLQKTSGVAASGSRGLPVEDGLRHTAIVSGEPYNSGGAILESADAVARASAASEPRARREPAQRRARARAGESEGQSPSVENRNLC